MSVASIRNSLKTRLEAAIPFTEADFTLNPSKNESTTLESKYTVAIGPQQEVAGVTRFATVDQVFIVRLFDGYIAAAESDSSVVAQIEALHTNADTIYSDFVNTRLSNADVMNVSGRILNEPIVDSEQKTIMLEMFVTVKYRFAT